MKVETIIGLSISLLIIFLIMVIVVLSGRPVSCEVPEVQPKVECPKDIQCHELLNDYINREARISSMEQSLSKRIMEETQ